MEGVIEVVVSVAISEQNLERSVSFPFAVSDSIFWVGFSVIAPVVHPLSLCVMVL